MKITFKHEMNLEDALVFENEYPEELRMDIAEKKELYDSNDAVFVWMFVDGELVGETYGVPLRSLDEPIEGLAGADPEAMYCYSNTILGDHQGKGLGSLLKAYWLGIVKGKGYHRVYGHARPNGSQTLATKFGGRFIGDFPNWYGTGQTYKLYIEEI